MSHFRDPIKRSVTFRLRPVGDLRSPKDAHRYKRAIETRRIPSEAPHEDDKHAHIADAWRAERIDWERAAEDYYRD